MDLKKASDLQLKLADKLDLLWEPKEVALVAGADFSYDREKKRIGAAIVVVALPEFEIIESVEFLKEVGFHYIPGFLAFREGPVFIEAFRKIKNVPQVTLVDGNGIAHPRKMGLASYVGVMLGISTVGCAKSPFFPFDAPGQERGEYTFFKDEKEEKVGMCLRTRTGVKPVFVSPGNKIDFMESMKIVLRCSKFRIPEPLRLAHTSARKIF